MVRRPWATATHISLVCGFVFYQLLLTNILVYLSVLSSFFCHLPINVNSFLCSVVISLLYIFFLN